MKVRPGFGCIGRPKSCGTFFINAALFRPREFFPERFPHMRLKSAAKDWPKIAMALALAKAPAASASTLTVIKGALKIMAWTKAKTAIVTGIIVLLATGTTAIVYQRNSESRGDAPANPRTTAATGSIKGRFFGRGQLVDAGNTTPEDAWESRYWARSQGDYDAVIAATDPQAVTTQKTGWVTRLRSASIHERSLLPHFRGFRF